MKSFLALMIAGIGFIFINKAFAHPPRRFERMHVQIMLSRKLERRGCSIKMTRGSYSLQTASALLDEQVEIDPASVHTTYMNIEIVCKHKPMQIDQRGTAHDAGFDVLRIDGVNFIDGINATSATTSLGVVSLADPTAWHITF